MYKYILEIVLRIFDPKRDYPINILSNPMAFSGAVLKTPLSIITRRGRPR